MVPRPLSCCTPTRLFICQTWTTSCRCQFLLCCLAGWLVGWLSGYKLILMSGDWTRLDYGLAAMNHILMLSLSSVSKCSRWEHKMWELCSCCLAGQNVRPGLVTFVTINTVLVLTSDLVTSNCADLRLCSANISICQHWQSLWQDSTHHNTPHLLKYLTRTSNSGLALLYLWYWVDGHPDLLVIYRWGSHCSSERRSDQIINLMLM